MRRLLLSLPLLLLPVGLVAQDTPGAETTARDRSFLTGLIEDNLSGAGRSVRLDGFAGALSSRATFEQLTIADSEGVWITIRNGAISWNRSALLAGRIDIDEMSAAEIELTRRPAAEGSPSEASGFSLPELPVSVSIGALRADRVVLGPPILGVPAEVRLQASMQLAGGEGAADIAVTRIDGREGSFTLKGSYSNATREATLDLLAKEAADGIAVQILKIPGLPSAEVAIHGSGVIDQFRTEVAIRTDGQPRVSGYVQLGTATDEQGQATRSFTADLAGDLAPLFRPEYQEFFGTEVSLQAEGRKLPSGQTDLTRLALDSRGVDLNGSLSLNPAGLPLLAAMTLKVGLADGSQVVLPIPGDRTTVGSADLRLRYDGRRDSGWTLAGSMTDLKRPAVSVGALTLDGSGRIDTGTGASAGTIGGTVSFDANQIASVDPALQEAIGDAVSGRTVFSWQPEGRLRLPVLVVSGAGYRASGNVSVGGLDSGIELSGDLTAVVADLARFSGLAGRPVGGSGTVGVNGAYGVLSGIADASIEVDGQDMSASIPELDNLLRGASRFSASIRRDETGTRIRASELRASTLLATAAGTISASASDLKARLDFSDLSAMGGRYRGGLTAAATMTGPAEARQIDLAATGNGLGIGLAEVDRIIGGKSDLRLSAIRSEDTVALRSFSLENGQITVQATGSAAADGQLIGLTSRLRDMALLAPGFPGPLSLEGQIEQRSSGYRLDLKANGPGSTTATISGTAASDFSTTNLAIAGSAESAVINPFIQPRNVSGPVRFDLRMNGAPGLSALGGTVALQSARLVAPTFGIQMAGVNISADLAGQRATLSGSGSVDGGGEVRLSGPVSLTAPFDGDLTISLASVRLSDPELFDTDVSGTVRVNGPMTGGAMISGAVALGTTELRIPSTGLGGGTLLDGVQHVAEPGPVRETRRRAGLIGEKGEQRAEMRPFGLDLTISAPARMFVRGRGIDAELGGSLNVGGTTAAVVPRGQFNLIRGRLDILGKRFVIDEGLIQLQGALEPYVRFGATTESEGIRATIQIEGDATAPEIHFLSSPELPEEEVIARLLFSKSLASLSPFQAAQLASAVATLAGKGGEGIVSKLRKSFGLDDLDFSSDEEGNTALRVGRYISEKVYTNVEVGSDGKAEVTINLDVTPSLTVRGTVAGDGTSGVGLFYERDY